VTRAQCCRRLAGLALIAALAACSSPNPALYTIAPVTGPEANAGPKVILLQQVAVERYLERLQIVRSSESFRLDVMSNDWWGEPLSAMLARVLVSELGQRLPRSVVFSESGAVSAQPDATIAVNIQRLDEDATGSLVLQSQVSVAFKSRATPTLRAFRFAVPPPTPDVSGEVAAISTAVGQLADGIASVVAAGPTGR
jgi:uncharacterized lipoprotein YmbA